VTGFATAGGGRRSMRLTAWMELAPMSKLARAAIAASAILVVAPSGCSDNGAPTQTPDSRAPSVARLWNEALLNAIRGDFARPTVHARNLFHVSAAMYDAWALYSDTASTYLAGKTVHGYTCELTGVSRSGDLQR